jgi:hypothetical protein
MRITSAGNVGIGTAVPGQLLHVSASSTDTVALQVTNTQSSITGFLAATSSTYNFAGVTASRTWLGSQNGVTIGPWDANTDIRFVNSGNEKARIDSSGRLLVGTSSSVGTISDAPKLQVFVGDQGAASFVRGSNNEFGPNIHFAKSRNTASGSRTIVQNNDELGSIFFIGDDGTDLDQIAARIYCQVDGTPGANDMPGRLVFSVTQDGQSSPTEALRITNDRTFVYNQADPVSKSANATLTIAELENGIITASAQFLTFTLPTGTDCDGGFASLYNNMTFQWSYINQLSGSVTIAANTGHTLVGSGSLAGGQGYRFATRRTGTNTWVTYRISN